MSNVPASGRSFERIARADLERLAGIATEDREDRFARKPHWRGVYGDRAIAVALCQGAALHYLDDKTGVQDFDVWTFYAEVPETPFPPRWRLERDFGDPKFGQSLDKPQFVGRRVDCIGRSISAMTNEDPAAAVRRYLRTGRTESARFLAKKAVVLLSPTERLGEVVWPMGAVAPAV